MRVQVTVIAAKKLHPRQGASFHLLIPLYTLGHSFRLAQFGHRWTP